MLRIRVPLTTGFAETDLINASNLHLKLSEKLSNTTTILTDSNLNLLEAAKSIQEMKLQKVNVVLDSSYLPTPSNELIGQLYFVQLERMYYTVESEFNYYFWRKLISPNGTLWTWGSNYRGRIAVSTTSRSSPGTTNCADSKWCRISSNEKATLALKTDCTLWGWGQASYGDLGSIGIATYSPVNMLGGGTNWCFISKGFETSAAIKTDCTLWVWGKNNVGQLGDGTTTNRSSPGTTAGGGNNWCQVSGGKNYLAGIKTDGTLWTWGRNVYGTLGDNSTISRSSPGTTAGGGTNWCQIAIGMHAIGIKTDGTLWTWGKSGRGQLGDGTIIARSSPGTTAGGGTTWCQVSRLNETSIAIKTDGTLWTWGSNITGVLGDGTTTSRSSPGTTAGGGTTWCNISDGSGYSGSYQSLGAIKSDGTLWTWGGNHQGQLGDGTTTSRSSPGTTAGGGTTWCDISHGGIFMTGILNVVL